MLLSIRHGVEVTSDDLKPFDALAYAMEVRELVGAPVDVMFGASPGLVAFSWSEEVDLRE